MKGKKTKVFDLDFRPAYFADIEPNRPALHEDTSAIFWGGNGGEYLPKFKKGEVEIACVQLHSTTGDVISVRARQAGKKIAYRIVDEYQAEFTITPQKSDLPLTLRELIALLDTADAGGTKGFTNSCRDWFLEEDEEADLEELAGFVTVSSEFYPQLRRWYEKEAQEWLDKVKGNEK